MIDIEEMMKRAQEASEAASKQLNESIEKSKKISEQMQADAEKAAAERAARQPAADEQTMANQQRQVEILGQMFNPEIMAQMAANEEMLQQMAEQKAAEATAGIMDQLFGEDMGVIAAALETLAMEEEDEDEEAEFDDALEAELYNILDEKIELPKEVTNMFREAHVYAKDECRNCWNKFYCSGGCHANAINFNNDIKVPYKLGCEMQKKRTECSIMIQAKMMLEGN